MVRCEARTDMARSTRFSAVSLAAVLVCSSCALFRGGSEPYPTGLVFPLAVDGQVAYEGEVTSLIQRTPIGIVFSTRKGRVYAIDEAGRKILWSYTIPEAVETPPVVGTDGLTVCDQTSELYRLSFKGELVWKARPKGRIVTKLAEANGVLYFGVPGEIVAWNAADGRELWRFRPRSKLTAGPLAAGGLVIIGCMDKTIRSLTAEGRPAWTFHAAAAAEEFIGVDEGRLFCGGQDGFLHAVDLSKFRDSWKVRTNGAARGAALVAGKRLMFLTANNVLYCLDKGCGNILWWQPVPARPHFDPVLAGERVVVATQSQVLVAFDIKTGLKAGEFVQDMESRSNTLWAAPFLMSNVSDESKEQGSLIFLKKVVSVLLSATLPSPLKEGQEVTFGAQGIGFFKPQFEFSLKTGDKVEVVQAASEKTQWIWYDSKEGIYTISVKAKDEKEMGETSLTYVIEKTAAAPPPTTPATTAANPEAPKAETQADKDAGLKPEKPQDAKDVGQERPQEQQGGLKMTRNEAMELVKAHLPNQNLVKHCLAVEACMKAVAQRLGQDAEPWGLAGLLHDLDYEKTAKSPDLHTTETVKMLEGRGLSPAVIHAIQAHAGKVPCESAMDWAIFSIDPLTGLIIAATLMHPSKKLEAIDLEFIKRRYKEKSFAKGARREEIEMCKNAGLELDEFISICIKAMQGIAADLGL